MSDTVIVACKLPNGLHMECGVGEAKTRVTLNGSRLPVDSDGNPIQKHVLAGNGTAAFGLTRVPADFWERWAAENAKYPPYAQGMIFVQPDEASAVACAREMGDIKTGLEPMSRDKKDMPKGVEPVL